MTSRIFPLYNDNTDHIDLNTICGYSICSKAENYMFAQDDSELSSEDYEYMNDIERERSMSSASADGCGLVSNSSDLITPLSPLFSGAS